MIREEFRIFIESIGFEFKELGLYYYKEFRIYLYYDYYYSFYNGSEWKYRIPYTDLTLVLKMIRCIKLKQILG